MKIYEVEHSGTVAWSPLQQYPSFLASGTVAGSLDVDFDTSAHLEIFNTDISKGKMEVVGRTSASDRFNKVCWGQTGVQSGVYPYGLIAGGLNNGTVNIWDASKIIGNTKEDNDDALIASCERHAIGPVQGLDFNPYQFNLLASGGSDSEIFIWDLQNPTAPTVYNPGAKQQVYENSGITCVQWNRKVQHILASSNYSGVTVVWDLKAKRAVLNFSSPNKKLRCKAMAWNPDNATQIITASEDDASPILELWDLRNTYSPTKVMEGHHRGIWSVSWCPMDSDLLVTCGKDNRTLCWNVNTGEILSEVEVNSQTWNFDVQWSPRIPAVLSTCSLERKISIFSVQDVRNSAASEKAFVTGKPTSVHAPKWLKRQAGVTFGFGGKIAFFKKPKQPTDPKSVQIAQIVTDKEFLTRADKLEEVLSQGDLKSYCDNKINNSTTDEEKSTWSLMKLLFEQTPRNELLQYLGFNPETIKDEIKQKFPALENNNNAPVEAAPVVEENKETTPEEPATEDQSNGNKDVSGLFGSQSNEENIFETISQQKKPEVAPVTEAKQPSVPIQFTEDGPEGLITRALIVGNFEAAVDCCVKTDRMADALILAAYGGPELWKKTQETYFAQKNKSFMRVVSSIVKKELRQLVEQADLSQWKSILAVICTYAKSEEFAILSNLLADRLLIEEKNEKDASECYICAGNIDKLLQLWVKNTSNQQTNIKPLQALQNLIEKISVFRKAVNHHDPLPEGLARKYSEYAQLLASQGKLESAAHCLSFLTEAKYEDTSSFPFVLLDRIYHSQKNRAATPPPFPFQRTDVSGRVAQQQAAPVKPTVAAGPTGYPQVSPRPTQPTGSFPPQQTSAFPTPTNSGFPPQQTSAFPQPTSAFPTPATSAFPTPASSGFPPQPFPAPSTAAFPHPTPSPVNPFPQPTSVLPPSSSVPAFPSPANNRLTGPGLPTPYTPGVMTPTSPSPVGPPPSSMAPASNPPPVSAPPPTTFTPNVSGNVPVPSLSSVAAKPAEKPKEPAKPAAPVATSTENSFIVQSLTQIINQCVSSTDPKVNKYAKDVQKRMEPLIEKLTRNEYSGGITQSFTQLCQAILNGDSRTAADIHVKITQQHWEELGSNLMIGLKRLIEITKS